MLTKTSIKKPFTVIVMIIVIAIVGGVAVFKMPLDLFPEMELPYMIVATMVPGAAPEKVEESVTNPLEHNLRQINNVKKVTSISAENVSAVIMELENGADLTTITQDIDIKIKAIRSSFPEMTMEPIIMKIDPDMMPIMTLAISKQGQKIEQSSEELSNIADKIRSVGGVASVSTTGQIDNNVFLQVNPSRLLSDPKNFLANHIEAYFDKPENRVMPEKVSNFIDNNSALLEKFGINIRNLIDNPHDELAKMDLDVGALLGDSKDMFLGMFSSMLTPDVISGVLMGNDFEMPAGTTTVNGLDFLVKVGEKVKTFDELQHLPAFALDLTTMQVLVKNFGKSTEEMRMLEPGEEKTIILGKDDKILSITQYLIDYKLASMLKPTMLDTDFDKLFDSISSKIANMKPELAGIIGTMKVPVIKAVKDLLYDKEGASWKRDNNVYRYMTDIIRLPFMIQLQDVAYMYQTNSASKAHTLINGYDGIMLSVYKTPDATVTSVTNDISKMLKDMHKNDETINYIILSNQGEVTKFMISSIAQNLLLGALFAVLVLLIFLRDWKPTLTVGASIIVSLVTAFAVMYLCGVTLNLVSMGGLALSVGMLVDNSIVVIENIYRKRNEGVSPVKAAYDGTKQVSGAILSSTITTVIVFLPVIFVEGITKQIFKDLAITIAVSLFASLIVAITLVPMISSRMLHLSKASRHESKAFMKLKQGYSKALNYMLNKKWITLVVVTVLFVASIVSVFFMDTEFLPNTQMEQVMVTVGIDKKELTEDYAYDEIVDDVITDINEEFKKKKYIKDMGIELSAGMTVMGFTMGGGNITSYITLDKKAKVKPAEAQKELQGIVENICKKDKYHGAVVPHAITDANGVDVQKMVSNYLDASLLGVNIYGHDVDKMTAAANELKVKFSQIGKKDSSDKKQHVTVNDGLANNTEQLKLVVDKEVASRYNFVTALIFTQLLGASMPPTANAEVNFTNEIGSNDIYIYTTENYMERWYRVKDGNGDTKRLYFNIGDATDKATMFEERTAFDNMTGKVTHTTIFEAERKDGKLTGKFTAKLDREYDANGKLISEKDADSSKVYTANIKDMPVYYDNSKIYDMDVLTFMLQVKPLGAADTNMQMPLAPEIAPEKKVTEIPVFMLLKDVSFALDNNQIAYRTAETNPEMLYDNGQGGKYYVNTTDKFIRYNFSGGDIDVLKTLAPDDDINPKVPLGIRKVEGFNTINHADGKRVIQMGISSAELSNKQIEREAKKIINEFNKKNENNGLRVEFVGQNEMISETFNSLILIIVLAVIFIYLVMVAQFQSLKSPFIIMFTIPLALTGSILTLLMAQMPISVFALVGIILLVGIVVNNGIVFVDYVNKLMQSGMPKREALLRSAQDRIRPILMTALTTICSMLISVFDTSMGASAIKPMAVTVVGGLIYATLLTLFFVPILYDLFNRKEKLAVIKFDDDKEDDIEAEMRLSNMNSVKEVLEESNTLKMMDETFIANNMPTETPMESYINKTTGEEIIKENTDDNSENAVDATTADDITDKDVETEATDDTLATQVDKEVSDVKEDEILASSNDDVVKDEVTSSNDDLVNDEVVSDAEDKQQDEVTSSSDVEDNTTSKATLVEGINKPDEDNKD